MSRNGKDMQITSRPGKMLLKFKLFKYNFMVFTDSYRIISTSPKVRKAKK